MKHLHVEWKVHGAYKTFKSRTEILVPGCFGSFSKIEPFSFFRWAFATPAQDRNTVRTKERRTKWRQIMAWVKLKTRISDKDNVQWIWCFVWMYRLSFFCSLLSCGVFSVEYRLRRILLPIPDFTPDPCGRAVVRWEKVRAFYTLLVFFIFFIALPWLYSTPPRLPMLCMQEAVRLSTGTVPREIFSYTFQTRSERML